MQKAKSLGKITYGFCCISNALKREGVSYRFMTYASYKKLGEARGKAAISKLVLHNCGVLHKIILWCAAHKLKHHRMSSSIFPVMTHPALNLHFQDLADFAEIKNALKSAGKAAAEAGISLSMHPGQFDVIGSASASVRKNTARDINLHAELMDIMGLKKDASAPINVHMNTDGRREAYAEDFADGLKMLSKSARARLVIENEDKGYWNAAILLEFLKLFKIPATFDFLHHKCNPCGLDEKTAFLAYAKTWGRFTPIFHYAESRDASNLRAHAEFCESLPPDYGINYICELEAKGKDDALLKLAK